jgi:hypothetical protein
MLRRLGRGLERLVGSDVHPGEWRLVLAFFVNLFLLLTAYYILKVVREPLILLGGGAVSRSYARGLQAGLLALVIPAYRILANRVEPARLVKWVDVGVVLPARAGGPADGIHVLRVEQNAPRCEASPREAANVPRGDSSRVKCPATSSFAPDSPIIEMPGRTSAVLPGNDTSGR